MLFRSEKVQVCRCRQRMACARTIPCCGRRDATRAQDRPVLTVCGGSVMSACKHALVLSSYPSKASFTAVPRHLRCILPLQTSPSQADLDDGVDVRQDSLGEVVGSYLLIELPLVIKNFPKFHLMSSPNMDMRVLLPASFLSLT